MFKDIHFLYLLALLFSATFENLLSFLVFSTGSEEIGKGDQGEFQNDEGEMTHIYLLKYGLLE